jgi:hypothetical protein
MNRTETNVHLLPRMAQKIEKDWHCHCYLCVTPVYTYLHNTVSFPFQGWSGTGDQFFPLHFNPLGGGK